MVSLGRMTTLLLCLLVLLGACATGKGSGFSREAARESSSRPSDQGSGKTSEDGNAEEEKKEEKPIPKVTVVVNPSNARITIGGRFAGTGSASFTSSGFGESVKIEVEAPSHRSRTLSVQLWGQTETLWVNLEPILGTLELLGDLSGARVSAHGRSLSPGLNRLLIGDYVISARRFGFQDQTHRVLVEEDQTTTLSLAFVPAEFALTGLKSDRPDGFNPDSAVIAASARLSFQASTTGWALLVLSDRQGSEVARWEFPNLNGWDQEAVWDGRRDGVALPDGEYTLTLTGGPGAEETVRRSIAVRIDRSLIDKDRPSLGPAPGLLWVPSAEVLSPGVFQLSVLGLGHFEQGLGHFPISTALRFAPIHGWEFFGQTSFRVWNDSSLNSVYFTFAVKRLIAVDSPHFRLAWVAGGTLASWMAEVPGIPPTDFLTTFPAVRALLPASWSLGRWTILVAPEVDGSYWSPSTAYEAATGAEEGFRLWGYGRVGLAYDPGPFSVALSGAARTRSFDRGTGWLAPAHLGLEARLPVPRSPLTLTGYLSVSAYSTVDYAWYGGVGVSLLAALPTTNDPLVVDFGQWGWTADRDSALPGAPMRLPQSP